MAAAAATAALMEPPGPGPGPHCPDGPCSAWVQTLSTRTTALTKPVLPEAQTLSTGTPPSCRPGPSTLWITIRQTFEVTRETGQGSHLLFPPVSHPDSISRPICSLSKPQKCLLSRGSWAQARCTVTPTREGWTRAKGCPAFLPSSRPWASLCSWGRGASSHLPTTIYLGGCFQPLRGEATGSQRQTPTAHPPLS